MSAYADCARCGAHLPSTKDSGILGIVKRNVWYRSTNDTRRPVSEGRINDTGSFVYAP